MNIYISNLSYSTNDSDLKDLFAPYGEVTSARIIKDQFSGKSRGFGFVDMFDTESSKNAMRELDNTQFDGNVISVQEARPKGEKTFGESNNGRGYKSDNNGGKRW